METQRQYEVVFIVNPDADDDEVTRLTDSFKQIVTDQGGTVTKTESMGRRKLAYEILHKTEGSFMLLEIEGSGREIAELDARLGAARDLALGDLAAGDAADPDDDLGVLRRVLQSVADQVGGDLPDARFVAEDGHLERLGECRLECRRLGRR